MREKPCLFLMPQEESFLKKKNQKTKKKENLCKRDVFTGLGRYRFVNVHIKCTLIHYSLSHSDEPAHLFNPSKHDSLDQQYQY